WRPAQFPPHGSDQCTPWRMSPQYLQKHPGLLQVGGVKALGEPAVDRRQELPRLGAPALALPEPCQAGGCPQFQGFCPLLAGDSESMVEMALRLLLSYGQLGQVQPSR